MYARHARKGWPLPDIEVRFLPTLEDQQPLPDFERQRFVRGFSWPSDPEGTEDDAWWHPSVRLALSRRSIATLDHPRVDVWIVRRLLPSLNKDLRFQLDVRGHEVGWNAIIDIEGRLEDLLQAVRQLVDELLVRSRLSEQWHAAILDSVLQRIRGAS